MAHFGFIGNNEAFTARSDSFGLGGGMQAALRTGSRPAVVPSAGAAVNRQEFVPVAISGFE